MGLETLKDIPQVLSMFYQDLAQPSVQQLGKALGIVFEFGTSFLLSIKCGNEKRRLNFEKRLNEYKNKIEDIPSDKLSEVNPQIGIPIMERLSYTTCDEVADLFTSLLAKASSFDTINEAHPSFIYLIERMTIDEARIVKYLRSKGSIPYVTFNLVYQKTDAFTEILHQATNLSVYVDLIFPENLSLYMDNLESMGIINNDTSSYLRDDALYDELIILHSYDDFVKEYISEDSEYKEVEIVKGRYNVTTYGDLFIETCTMTKL